MRLIDGDKLKRKVQRIATEAWMMKLTASVETTLNQFIDYIDEAPTLDKPQWIPCSERLPERLERVLVTRANGRVEETFKWNNEEYPWNGGYDDVLAWMPLPAPWKGADDE